jgi:hypothetical protein
VTAGKAAPQKTSVVRMVFFVHLKKGMFARKRRLRQFRHFILE